ncbi:MAG: NAD(+)/NADH kinase [Treponema sp.]|jgi:NAD+ kinase|nr:NAD(+)/NADH kinase [Treponema sp.]
MAALRRVLLFINLHKSGAQGLADEIGAELKGRGLEVDSFTFRNEGLFTGEGVYDLAFSLGGDGTVLYTARAMAPLGTPIIPVNLGTLGFIAVVHPAAWKTILGQWEEGRAPVSGRFMLELAIERRGRRINLGCCLNDAVISATGIAKLIRLRVESVIPPFREEGLELVRLGEYRSDGLIVATPTGSTAYSVASGGPILEPEMEAMIINPICPFALSNRPIVLSPGETVIVTVEKEQRSGVLLTIDGQVTEALEPGDRIYIRKAPFRALLVASDRRGFYNALRVKLAWPVSGPREVQESPRGGAAGPDA